MKFSFLRLLKGVLWAIGFVASANFGGWLGLLAYGCLCSCLLCAVENSKARHEQDLLEETWKCHCLPDAQIRAMLDLRTQHERDQFEFGAPPARFHDKESA